MVYSVNVLALFILCVYISLYLNIISCWVLSNATTGPFGLPHNRLVRLFFSAGTVFFSHNNSIRTVFFSQNSVAGWSYAVLASYVVPCAVAIARTLRLEEEDIGKIAGRPAAKKRRRWRPACIRTYARSTTREGSVATHIHHHQKTFTSWSWKKIRITYGVVERDVQTDAARACSH